MNILCFSGELHAVNLQSSARAKYEKVKARAKQKKRPVSRDYREQAKISSGGDGVVGLI